MKKLVSLFIIIASLSVAVVLISKPEAAEETTEATLDVADLQPEELAENITAEEELFIYMYSPVCTYCQKAAPIIMPLVYENAIPFQQFNVRTHAQIAVNDYGVESTPTLIHYKNGSEVDRLIGLQKEEVYKQFFSVQ